MNSESPSRKTWKRFRKNKLAFAGFIVILFCVFISVFCYVFIPDSTPYANRINLSLSNQSPGFKSLFVKKNKQFVQESSFIDRIFFGTPDEFDFIPVTSYHFEKNEFLYSIKGDNTYSDRLNIDKQIPEQLISSSLETKQEYFMHHFLVEKRFIFGTDRYGRDLFSRLIAGTRVTFTVGFVAVIISLFIGIFFGSLAGFFKGRVDQFVLWLINVVWSVPTLLLVIAITLVLGKGFEQVFIAVGLTMWVDIARLVRSQLFSVRELEFVAAGKSMGFRNSRIIIKHMLPNISGPVLVVAASNFSTAILLEAGLSFLGIGAQPPTPSWGTMIKENYGFIIIPESAYLAILPGLAIMILTMAFTFVANGLRDAMDSRTQITLA